MKSTNEENLFVTRQLNPTMIECVGKVLDDAKSKPWMDGRLGPVNKRFLYKFTHSEHIHTLAGSKFLNELDEIIELTKDKPGGYYQLANGSVVYRVSGVNMLTKEVRWYFVATAGTVLCGVKVNPATPGSYPPGDGCAIAEPALCEALVQYTDYCGFLYKLLIWSFLFLVTVCVTLKALSLTKAREIRQRWNPTKWLLCDFRLYAKLKAMKMHTMKNPGSDNHYRMVMAACANMQRPSVVEHTTAIYLIYNSQMTGLEDHDCVLDTKRQLSAPIGSDPLWLSERQGVGPGWIQTEDNTVTVRFAFNGTVELVKGEGVTFVDGRLKFEVPYSRPTNMYYYGPHLASSAVVYTCKSTVNIETGFMRISNSREDEDIYREYQDMLTFTCVRRLLPQNADATKALQYKVLEVTNAFNGWSFVTRANYVAILNNRSQRRRRHYVGIVALMLDEYATQLVFNMSDELTEELTRIKSTHRFDLAEEYALRPHAKQRERLLAIEEIAEAPLKHETPPKYVEAKVKYEFGKAEKICRQYVTLGPVAAMNAPDIPEFMKHIMAAGVVLNNRAINGQDLEGSFRFVPSPTMSVMDAWARETYHMHDGTCGNQFRYYFHSDDSHMSFRTKVRGELYAISVGMDIAKCDLSHGPGLFAVAMALMLGITGLAPSEVAILFEQLKCDIMVRHPDPNSSSYAKFRTKWMLLFSGSTLTTYVNNVACLLLGISFYSRLLLVIDRFPSHDAVKELLLQSAKSVGYEVTLDSYTATKLTRNGDLGAQKSRGLSDDVLFATSRIDLTAETFLKHFPVRGVEGSARAYKCLSTLLRSFGIADECCELEQRRKEILQGWSSMHRTPFFEDIYTELDILASYRDEEGYQLTMISNEEIARRYKIEPTALHASFIEFFSCNDVVSFYDPNLMAILKVGYGLKCV